MSQQAKMTSATNITLGQAMSSGGSGYGAIPGINVMGGTYSIGTQHEFEDGIDLRVTPATGGYIISVSLRGYHVTKPELHLVTEDKDLGAEIGKIITMTCLKKETK